MDFIILIISLLLIGVATYLLLRIVSLVWNVRRNALETFYNTINAWFLLGSMLAGFAFLFWYIFSFKKSWLPELASLHGIHVDTMFWITMVLTGTVFLVTQFLLFYFSFRFRTSPGRTAYHQKNNNKLELIWTIIPLITFLLIFYFSHNAWIKLRNDQPDALNIEIMGEQFNWRIRYAGSDRSIGAYSFLKIDEENDFGIDLSDTASFDDFSPVQLHLPKGVPVRLRIRSRDVIHSVDLPNFRVKMDAVPGMPTSFTFVPTFTTEELREKTGNPDFNYEMACTELCGRMHFAMLMIVVVEEKDEFDQWSRAQKPWLYYHKNYLTKVPDAWRDLAEKKSGLSLKIAENFPEPN